MNQPAMTVEHATVQPSTDSGQTLHGPWLFIARVAWIALTLLLLRSISSCCHGLMHYCKRRVLPASTVFICTQHRSINVCSPSLA